MKESFDLRKALSEKAFISWLEQEIENETYFYIESIKHSSYEQGRLDTYKEILKKLEELGL